MGGMCLCRTFLFSSYLGGSSHQDALGPCERQTSSLPWPSEPWTMPIQELHCIIDGDIVMAGPRYGAVARAARVALPLMPAIGFPRSLFDCRTPVGSLLAGSRSCAGLGPYSGKPVTTGLVALAWWRVLVGRFVFVFLLVHPHSVYILPC